MRTLSRKYSFLFYLLMICFACQEKQTEGEVKTISKYCQNELTLLAPPDSLPIVKIDFRKDSTEIIQKIEKQLQVEFCDSTIHFALKIRNGSLLKASIYKDYCALFELSTPDRGTAHFFLKKNGELILDGISNSIDSICTWSSTNLYEYHDYKYISFIWEEGVTVDNITKTIKGIKEGYLTVCNSIAKQRFKKELCQLDEQELKILKKIFPFNLQIDKWTLNGYPMPPPPELIIAPEMN